MTDPRLTHRDDAGAARMVDVTEKTVTARVATAAGRVLVSPEVVALLRGDPLERIAQDVGYGSATALSRAFAGVCGVSPRTWRNAQAPSSGGDG